MEVEEREETKLSHEIVSVNRNSLQRHIFDIGTHAAQKLINCNICAISSSCETGSSKKTLVLSTPHGPIKLSSPMSVVATNETTHELMAQGVTELEQLLRLPLTLPTLPQRAVLTVSECDFSGEGLSGRGEGGEGKWEPHVSGRMTLVMHWRAPWIMSVDVEIKIHSDNARLMWLLDSE